ncbi:MAG: zinc ribbon domain-containing protein [Bdellovibrionota bacterium]
MIYEYACKDCEHRFEVWAKVSDPAPTECPECKSSNLEKVIGHTSFALKGSGWYTTDYKKKTSTPAKGES